MLILERPHAAGQSSAPPVRTRADRPVPANPPPGHRRTWFVRVRPDFWSFEAHPYSDGHKKMIQIMEGYAQGKCYLWPRNETLARDANLKLRHLQTTLAEMERAGLIHRVPEDSAKTGRVGIILRWRSDPAQPVADTPELLGWAIASLKEHRDAARQTLREGREIARETAPPGRVFPRPGRARKNAPGIRGTLSWNEDELELEEGSGPSERQRPGPTEPADRLPDGPPPAPAAEPAGPMAGALDRIGARMGPAAGGRPGEGSGMSQARPLGAGPGEMVSATPGAVLAAVGASWARDPGSADPPLGPPPEAPGPGPAGAVEMPAVVWAQLKRERASGAAAEAARPAAPAAAVEAPPPGSEVPGPTPRQSAWLAELDPGRRGAFAALRAGKRAELLGLIESGGSDPCLVAMVEAELGRARAAVESGPPPATTAELLGRIREDPSYPVKAGHLLALEFGDQKSYGAFVKACEGAHLGARDPSDLVEAYRQATGPQARNRGAVFMVALKRLARRAEVEAQASARGGGADRIRDSP